jgi:peptidoglycan/LPS O-acetylase OafA/YrhL
VDARAVLFDRGVELRRDPGSSPGYRDGPRRGASLIYGGKISYGLYVYHYAAITFANLYVRSFYIKLAVEFALTVTLAIASYELFERRFLELKRRFTVIESREV